MTSLDHGATGKLFIQISPENVGSEWVKVAFVGEHLAVIIIIAIINQLIQISPENVGSECVKVAYVGEVGVCGPAARHCQ